MRFAFILLSLLTSQFALAQIDPSSAVLLNQNARASTREGGLDSGRYTVKPGTKPSSQPVQRQQPSGAVEVRPVQSAARPTPSPTPGEQDQLPKATLVTNPAPGTFLSGASVPLAPEPPITEVILGGTEDEIEMYKELLNPEDRRHNLMELSIAPMFIYNTSKSPYLYRDYSTAGPGVAGDARVWFSPFFGVQASYMATLSGTVSDSFSAAEYVTASQTWLRAGIRSRSFLTTGRNSPSLTWGLDFYEYIFRVPKDADNRARLRTNGASITLDGEWPTSGRHSWLLGLSFLPKAAHKEFDTNLSLKTGQSVETNGVGISVGTRVQYDRSSAMFIRISHQLEKHVFGGAANLPDPRTGTAPNGVPVLNSFTILQVGYTWGN